MQKLLNKADVCELLGISRQTLDRIVASGELEALRIRGQVRFDELALRAYIERCRTASRRKAAPQPAPKIPGKPGRPKGSKNKPKIIQYVPGMKVV